MSWKLSILAVFTALVFTVPAVAQDGLIGYWPMDEGSGDTVGDASGNGNDATAQNTNWVAGMYGNALEFDGSTSVVDIPYSADMTPTVGATMSAWVFPTDDTRSCVFGQFEAYGMALNTDLLLKWVIWGDDWKSDIAIPMEEWSHMAMTWNVENGHGTMVLNGELVGEREDAIPVPQVQNNLGIGFWVGWPAEWGDDWFTGSIDDVRLWNRALTVAEISEVITPVQPQGRLATVWGSVKSSL